MTSPTSPTVPRAVVFSLTQDLFVGSYQRVGVIIDPDTGLSFEDIAFDVPDGRGTTISMSRDETFDPRGPTIMLLAGDVPDDYTIVATERSTGRVVGGGQFTVTSEWADPLLSPSRWVAGNIPLYGPQPTWGGGSSKGPQNVPVTPQSGPRKLVIALVDTNEGRWPTTGTTIADAQQKWADNIVNGVVGSDGITRSVAQYFREVSYLNGSGGMDINAEVLPDVVHLPGSWDTYFGLDSNKKWQAVGTFCRTVMTTGGVGRFNGADFVVCVVQPVSTPSQTKVAWPYGGLDASATTSPPASLSVVARGVVMSNTWGDGPSQDQGSGRTIYESLTHELGHGLHLIDAYKPVVGDRNVGSSATGTSWDPMAWDKPLPHFTAAHRLELGWIKPGWVKCFDFLALGALVDEEVVLAPVEDGQPFPNAFSAIEVRVGDGHNYYFEYRRGKFGEIGDENLKPNGRVVGTDVSAASDSRPDVLLLDKHPDDDGAVLDEGRRYHEQDATTLTAPVEFRLEVISIRPNMARVRVKYEVFGRPDPTIRPWPRDPAHPWQSPDIEVSNAKSLADPQFRNVPWNGHPNTVTAKIGNHGTAAAPAVTANFYWKDYTVGGAPETFIGKATHDIARGGTVNFNVQWTPVAPANPSHPQHYCIVVRIKPYSTPTTPPIKELTPLNNEAQSNYARFISASASPPSRQVSEVMVSNPYDSPTRFFLQAGQTHPAYRTYLEHTCLTLDAGEIRPVEIMFEYAPDTLEADAGRGRDDHGGAEKPVDEKPVDEEPVRPNHVSVVGLIEDPGDPFLHGPSLVTGVNAEVAYGRATRFEGKLAGDQQEIQGSVITVDDGQPVPGGSVVLVATLNDQREPEYVTVEIEPPGRFHHSFASVPLEVVAHFVPPAGFGECVSDSRQ
jgi:hypothetical protein